jgi:glucosamine--fructose-6-phosphate aminotransferase (isomerizing)
MHHMIQEIREEVGLLDKYLSGDREVPVSAMIHIQKSKGCITSGNGTSYNAAYYLSLLLLQRNVLSIPVFASEFSNFMKGEFAFQAREAVLFSQSGETSDIISAASYIRKRSGSIISISNVPASSLTKLSDISILTPAGPEKSIAATKSHMGQLLSSLSIYFANEPEELNILLGNLKEGFKQIMGREEDIRKFAEGLLPKVIFLGSGLDYPVAREGALKLKETCSMITDAYPTREFLHGPKQILDDSWTVFILSREEAIKHELSKLSRNVIDLDAIMHGKYNIKFHGEIADSILKVLFVQLLSYYRAVFLGLDPDKPSKLTKVITS